MAMQHAEYLGDGIYIHYDDQRIQICLTVGHHDPEHADNVIWFEPNEILALKGWINKYYPSS